MKYMQPPSSKEVFKVSEQEAEILTLRGWKTVSAKEVKTFYTGAVNEE